jgi:hypothetical protein
VLLGCSMGVGIVGQNGGATTAESIGDKPVRLYCDWQRIVLASKNRETLVCQPFPAAVCINSLSQSIADRTVPRSTLYRLPPNPGALRPRLNRDSGV